MNGKSATSLASTNVPIIVCVLDRDGIVFSAFLVRTKTFFGITSTIVVLILIRKVIEVRILGLPVCILLGNIDSIFPAVLDISFVASLHLLFLGCIRPFLKERAVANNTSKMFLSCSQGMLLNTEPMSNGIALSRRTLTLYDIIRSTDNPQFDRSPTVVSTRVLLCNLKSLYRSMLDVTTKCLER
jgi:hypothetical protein